MERRPLLIALLACAACPTSHGVQRASLDHLLRVGAEQALIDSALAAPLVRGFGRDTGVAVQLVAGSSAAMLSSLEQGEIDIALTNAAPLEIQLEQRGLAHDRRQIAQGDVVLVGPAAGRGGVVPGVAGEPDVAVALQRIGMAGARFVSASEGSGAHLAELELWRAAQVLPAAPWYSSTPSSAHALALAAAEGAYTLVERGRWMAKGPRSLSIAVQGDARMAMSVQVMRSFRASHPAGKLFVQWVTGRAGQRIAHRSLGWRRPAR